MELREDTCTLGSNNTYRRPHTTYEAYDTGKGCQRYLKGVTGTDISLEDLYMMLDERIDGLPKKADNLINNTKNNAKTEQMRGALDGRLTPQSSDNMYSDMYKYGETFFSGFFDTVDNGSCLEKKQC